MRETKPMVSIIMASYNHAAYIGAAVESVQSQDYDAWELLIADDASTDRTLEVLAAYTGETRIKVFPFTVNREHHMRNYAARQAQGDYFAFLNSDDVFLPGKLKKQVEVLESHPQIAAVFTQVQCIDGHGRRRPGHELEKVFAVGNQTRQQWLRRFFLTGNCLCISSAMVRRACFDEVGGFDPLLIQISDLDLWVKLCLRWDIQVIPEPLTAMRILAGDRNLSAASSVTASRAIIEYQHAYDHYFSAEGLELMPAIFPELASVLAEDTPAWRCYLLGRLATTLPRRPVRLLGFHKLHELLMDDEVRKSLLSKNRRLLRTLLLTEGTAALDRDRPSLTWKVQVRGPGDAEPATAYTFWTAAPNRGVVCLSVPNPGISRRLSLGIDARGVSLKRCRLRLYDPQTANLIRDVQGTGTFEMKIAKGKQLGRIARRVWGSRREDEAADFCFPEIDFTAFASREIDLEAEIETRNTWRRLRGWLHSVGRRLLQITGARSLLARTRFVP